jgi:hypothetical protein
MTFTIILRCSVFPKDKESKAEPYTDNIEIEFTKEAAEKFLFRFYDPIFDIDGYKFIWNYSNKSGITRLSALTLSKGDNLYIVRNLNQVIQDCLTGYIQICAMEKAANIVDFDFETAIENTCVIEEEE